MSHVFLLQTGGLSGAQESVREQFQRGGSMATVLWVVGFVVAAVWLVRYLTRRQAVARGETTIHDPARLFRDLLRRLALPPVHRHLLERVARDLRLRHPTVLLVSPMLFDRYLCEWRRHQTPSEVDVGPPPSGAMTDAIRQSLFAPCADTRRPR